MTKNNEVKNDEINEGVNEEKNNEPTITELMAVIKKQGEQIEALMAEKKTAEIKEQRKQRKDPFRDTVLIELPEDLNNLDDVFVRFNGRRYQIKRGYQVRVPKGVKEIIDNSRKQDIATLKKIRAMQAK